MHADDLLFSCDAHHHHHHLMTPSLSPIVQSISRTGACIGSICKPPTRYCVQTSPDIMNSALSIINTLPSPSPGYSHPPDPLLTNIHTHTHTHTPAYIHTYTPTHVMLTCLQSVMHTSSRHTHLHPLSHTLKEREQKNKMIVPDVPGDEVPKQWQTLMGHIPPTYLGYNRGRQYKYNDEYDTAIIFDLCTSLRRATDRAADRDTWHKVCNESPDKLTKVMKYFAWNWSTSKFDLNQAANNIKTHGAAIVKELNKKSYTKQCKNLLEWLNAESMATLAKVVDELVSNNPQHPIAVHMAQYLGPLGATTTAGATAPVLPNGEF